jgi:hypothetical protein
MPEEQQVEFVLRDKVEGVEITPDTIDLSRFNDFNREVEDFIAGSEGLSTKEVHVRVETGSYKLKAILPLTVMTALLPDIQLLNRQDSLGEIDHKRAEIVAKWQSRAKRSETLSYALLFSEGGNSIQFTRETDYRIGEIVPWVRVEKYLFGTIVDMGGAGKVNVHLRLQDSGTVVRIGTNQGYLHDQQENRLYHLALVRVEAEQHYKTGEIRDYRLLSFEDYEAGYDEAALDRFAEIGRTAWADVPDAADWVRKMRGGDI